MLVAKTRVFSEEWIRGNSTGNIEILPGGQVKVGEGLTIEMGSIEPNSHRMSVEMMLGEGGEATVSLPGISLGLLIDPEDPEIAKITLSSGELDKHLEFRTRPDVSRWSHDSDEIERFGREFDGSPGWTERWVGLGYDIRGNSVRFRFQGRFIGELVHDTRRAPSLTMPAKSVIRHLSTTPLGDLDARYQPIDTSPYFNCCGEKGNREGGMTMYAGVPFLLDKRANQYDNIDLGKMTYRERLPYIFEDSLSMDDSRVLLRVPKGYYDRLHLLCTVVPGESKTPHAAARMIKTGLGHAITTEFGPIVGEKDEPRHVQVDLSPGEFQEYLEDEDDFLEIDLTKRVGLDDSLYPHPDGPPSSIHVHAATLETAPVRMVVRWEGGIPLFEQPSDPRVHIDLKNQREREIDVKLRMVVTGPYGHVSATDEQITLGAQEGRILSRDLPQNVTGKFDLDLRIESEGGCGMVHRSSFALLPVDTREAKEESPFGMWCFFDGHLGLPPERAAPILRMAGARWTLPGFLLQGDDEQKTKRLETIREHLIDLDCGNVCCIGNTCCEEPGDTEAMIERMRGFPPLRSWMVFWETHLSRRHLWAFPNELLDRPTTPLTEQERRYLDNCWETGIGYSKRVREEFPDVNLVFGNCYPSFIGAMMSRGYPKEYIDFLGLDFDLFTSVPERQPGALFAPFSNIFILRSLQRIYGYEEYPIFLTEAIYSPVGEGWLTERQQADFYVRSHLLALASGVVFFGMCTSPYDPGDEYFYSHYGPIGLLKRPPGLAPRESFCAYSTMTRMLDRARFDRVVPTGSHTAFALRFIGPSGAIHALWTLRGSRTAVLRSMNTGAFITDMFGNCRGLEGIDGELNIEIGTSPVYLEGVDRIDEIELVGNQTGSEEQTIRLTGFEHTSDWVERPGTRDELESLKPDVPYFVGGVETRVVQRDGGLHLEVGPPDPPKNHPHEIPYTLVEYLGGDVEIPAGSIYIGARVFGNSSWGRILFLLEDSNGNSWLSVRGDTSIDFDGWQKVQIRLPHGQDANRVVRTGFESWVSSGDADPAYPMRLTGLVLEVRSHVIYVDELQSVKDGKYLIEEIFIKNN
jgi:hypothetical protein